MAGCRCVVSEGRASEVDGREGLLVVVEVALKSRGLRFEVGRLWKGRRASHAESKDSDVGDRSGEELLRSLWGRAKSSIAR